MAERPSMADVIEMHRKRREEDRRKRQEMAELVERTPGYSEEEDDFVPAGPAKSSADRYLENKDREEQGLPPAQEDKITDTERDFMRGDLPPAPDEEESSESESPAPTPPPTPIDFFGTARKGVETAEDKFRHSKREPAPTFSIPERSDDSDLKTALADADRLYNNAKSQLDKREAIETFFNAIGRIGAGMAGRATGTDMSGVKFDRQDWDKKREMAAREFGDTRTDIRQQGRDRESQHQFNVRATQANQQLEESARAGREAEALRKDQLNEQARHNRAMEAIGQANLLKDLTKKSAAANDQWVEKVQKASEETRKSLASIENHKEWGDDEKHAARRAVIAEQTGLSPEKVDRLMTEQGWVWDSEREIDEILKDLTTLFHFKAYKQHVLDQAAQQYPDHAVIYQVDESGTPQWNVVPNSQVSQIPNGWTILQ